MQVYPRPTEKHVDVPREDVEGECPECGEAALQAYPVLSEGRLVERDQVPGAACARSSVSPARCSAGSSC